MKSLMDSGDATLEGQSKPSAGFEMTSGQAMQMNRDDTNTPILQHSISPEPPLGAKG
jgi:hypothetical protein